jgi:hypothetical protein
MVMCGRVHTFYIKSSINPYLLLMRTVTSGTVDACNTDIIRLFYREHVICKSTSFMMPYLVSLEAWFMLRKYKVACITLVGVCECMRPVYEPQRACCLNILNHILVVSAHPTIMIREITRLSVPPSDPGIYTANGDNMHISARYPWSLPCVFLRNIYGFRSCS